MYQQTKIFQKLNRQWMPASLGVFITFSFLAGGVFTPVATGQSVVNKLSDRILADDHRMAAGFYSRGQWNEAIVALQDLIAEFPNSLESLEGHFYLGESLMQVGNYSEAYSAYQIFLRRLPDHAFGSRATFRMGEAAYRIENWDSALRLLEVFVRENPHDAFTEYALPYLGEIRLRRREPQLAQRAYETALRIYPNGSLSDKCRLGLAKSFQQQGANEQALRFYEYFLDNQGSPLAGEAQLQIGIISFAKGNYSIAQQHLNLALPKCETTTTKAEAAYWLARTYIADQKFDQAFSLLDSVASFGVNEALASAIYFDGAVAATKIDQTDMANVWLTNLLEQFPDNELADDALHLQIEIAQQSASDTTLNLIEKFRKEYPNSRYFPSVLESAGRYHYANKNYDRSIADFRKLLNDGKHTQRENRRFDRANWYYMLGLSYLGLDQFQKAESALSHIDADMETEQLRPLVKIAMATAKFRQKDYDGCIPYYRSYLNLINDSSNSQSARTELTIALAESGKWDEVVGAFEDLRRFHGNQPVVMETAEYLAEKCYREKETQRAVGWYQIMAEPGNQADVLAKGLSGLGWLQLETGDAALAQQTFDRLLAECPDSQFAPDAAMARAKVLDDNKEFSRAAQMYGLIIRQFPQNKHANIARLRRAHALQKLGGRNNLLEAKTLLTEYFQLPPATPFRDEALYQLGWINTDLGLPDDANEQFERVVDAFPQSKFWSDAAFRVAQHLMVQKKYGLVQPLVDQITSQETTPDEILVRTLFLQGELAAAQLQWDVVNRSMQRLLATTAEPAMVLKANYWLAESMYHQKQFVSANERFAEIKEDPGLGEKLQPWVWLRLAQCYGKQNLWSEALQTAEKGKILFPKFPADYEFDYLRGRGLEDAGRLTDCRAAYQSVVDSPRGGSTETAAVAQWRIGETYFHQEKYESAIGAYGKVDSLFSYPKWRSAALLQAGKCQEHLNNWRHALKLYQQLVKQFPETEYANTAQTRISRVVHLANVEKVTRPR